MPSSVRYQSTRGGVRDLDFTDILLSAYAADGGLFVPMLATMPSAIFDQLHAGMSLAHVTARLLHPFTGIEVVKLVSLCAAAFSSFNNGHEPSLPLVRVGDRYFLETGAGPTLAFKDIGQQVVAQLLNHVLGSRGERATIIVETSGDTGPAAIEAVRGCSAVRIFCLYPMGRVSHVQELQMITVDSPNVHVYRTEGDTDEQAEALKVVFTDAEFMRRHKVCSINSINWARVLVQSGYYLWACLQVAPDARMRVNFVVPTGAFGNAAGGLLAKRLGAPIERIVCATNANDIVHRTIQTGDLSFGANRQTISPAMDIQFAYNLERLLYLCSAGDCSLVKAIMTELESTRAVQLPRPLLDAIQQTFLSCAVDDAQTLQAMREVYLAHGYALDPHSAIGVYALDHVHAVKAACRENPTICVLTAHPAKFGEACAQAGLPPSVCDDPRVDVLKTKPHHFTCLRDPGAGSRPDKLQAWAREIKRAVEDQDRLAQTSVLAATTRHSRSKM